ncbi:hypothetical protein [Microbispora sp. NBRC 16548]|uniref:hypothetical protein n=1 Tax=Microbispora sp. NBRC 16548 TaxID=3030994 RepID=UPI0024A1F76A|nr:hypothetical protein [Microbispora sp. NBRC 16548]GLX06732.1 hypothetical protein Misp03_36590 [Microbispora sp. NBRC 16548]
MPTTIADVLPSRPDDQWNVEWLDQQDDEGELMTVLAIDADTGQEAELRALALVSGEYDADLRCALAEANEAPWCPAGGGSSSPGTSAGGSQPRTRTVTTRSGNGRAADRIAHKVTPVAN